MPFSSSYPEEWREWEIDPSTRESLHIWTKWSPVDATLATAGTAQDLFTIPTLLPTVNLITNPSMETADPPTGFTASGATIARSATVARTGTNSLRITPNNAAIGEGAYWTTDLLANQRDPSNNSRILVVSAYFRDNAASGNTARIQIRSADGVTINANGNTVTFAAAATWYRSTAFFPLTNIGAAYRIYFVTAAQHGTVFYVDSAQEELLISSVATDYCDGSLGNTYEWEGTANASRSRRKQGLLVIRGYSLYVTRNCYLAFDSTAASTNGRFIRAGTDLWNHYPIHIQTNISFINEIAGETPRIYGTVEGVHGRF